MKGKEAKCGVNVAPMKEKERTAHREQKHAGSRKGSQCL
jgi:hypothetical protein